ncbi:MAG: TlpA family protein disulfide reductase [Sulfurimonas sp.]|nr:TlpA family protein disulfide reductase [Sulfurimonas sp.]
MLKKALFATLITLSTLFFVSCDDDPNDMVSSNEFVLTTLDNTEIVVKKDKDAFYIENKKDKIVIFDIFATWCPPCQDSVSHLNSLQDKFKDDLIIIGITIEEQEFDKDGNVINDKLNDFKAEYNAKYIMVNSSQNKNLNAAITTMLEMGPRHPIPVIAMYKDGEYINHYVGAVHEEFIESDIKRALGK